MLTFGDFTGKHEADIEDMFEPDFYLDLVNSEFKKELQRPLQVSDLVNIGQRRIITTIEDYLTKYPLQGARFTHYRPARYFSENVKSLGPMLSKGTLDRFEAAFRALNLLIK